MFPVIVQYNIELLLLKLKYLLAAGIWNYLLIKMLKWTEKTVIATEWTSIA
jgi:uncharacterized protein (UPF0333 family)